MGTCTLVRTAASLSADRARLGAAETFLRRAGIDESYIEFFRSTIGSPIEFYSWFISCTRADKSFATRVHDHLQTEGIHCWLDEHEIFPGDKILTAIDRGIRLWDKILLCCSRASLEKSWWWTRESTRRNKRKSNSSRSAVGRFWLLCLLTWTAAC